MLHSRAAYLIHPPFAQFQPAEVESSAEEVDELSQRIDHLEMSQSAALPDGDTPDPFAALQQEVSLGG